MLINDHAPTMAYTFVALTVMLLLMFAWGCSTGASTPARPSGVPAQATYVPGGKVGGWWQHCVADEHLQAHCSVWNRVGLQLHDEVFLPYDGRPAITQDELSIVSDWEFPGDDRIRLTNGRILLPASRFDELKRLFDRVYGASSPHQGSGNSH